MYPVVLTLLVVAVAYGASFTLRYAPQNAWIWKFALAAGEYGVLFAGLAAGLGVLAGVTTDGALRIGLAALCAFAGGAFLRPVFSARRIGATLRADLQRAFGEAARAEAAPFSLVRLVWHAVDAPGPIETHAFSPAGGAELKLDFFRPRNAPPTGAPCLVVVHGGGWDGGARTQLPGWNHRWTARGYAVADVDYRLAPRHPWPAARDDVFAAVDWLKRHARELGLDATRFVLLGRSAGGQIATAVAYAARDPAIRGVVSYYAPQDMEFAWSIARADDALNSVNLLRQYFGGPPDSPERRQLYTSASAHAMISPAAPPTLLLHGRLDTLVWYRHSERKAAALCAAGVRHFHLELPWATHAFDFNADGPGGQLADHAIESFLRATVRA